MHAFVTSQKCIQCKHLRKESQVKYNDPLMKLVLEVDHSEFLYLIFDPPGNGRIGGHYFHTWCPYVRPSQKWKCATKDTMRENNDHLLAEAWWVTLKSCIFLFLTLQTFGVLFFCTLHTSTKCQVNGNFQGSIFIAKVAPFKFFASYSANSS